MKNLHPTPAGLIGFALSGAILDALVHKGVLTSAEQTAILVAARESLRSGPGENFKFAGDALDEAIIARPEFQ